MQNSLEIFLNEKLQNLQAKNLLRSAKTYAAQGVYIEHEGKKLINFSSNDYLGLSQNPQVIEAGIKAAQKYGAGAQASRLVTGNHPLYDELESAIAQHYGTQDACVFGSGYMANIGAIPTLVGKGDLVITDKLIHACVIDAVQLSGAEFKRFKHNDVENLQKILAQSRAQYKNCLVITEGVFSMDGDAAPLEQIQQICHEYNTWLMVDCAHQLNYQPLTTNHQPIIMGTLSKAIGAYGGYIAGSSQLIKYLKTSARSLIYTTGLPPATLASAIEAFKIIKQNPKILEVPIQNAKYFLSLYFLSLRESCHPVFITGDSDEAIQKNKPYQNNNISQIVPIIYGSPEKTLAVQQKLYDAGFMVSAIRPPTVPENTSRLRISFTALHTKAMVEELAKLL
jgi:8-amino-7-oxononanoate synthase